MSAKILGIGIVVLVIIIGGYFILTNYAAPMGENQTAGANETVQVQDITAGEGAEATPGSRVSVLYVGRFEDGTVFDSSETHNNEPLVFVLGEPGLLAGFQIGVNGMKEGGERVMVVPASLGYGAQEIRDPEGKVIIPANSTLVFNVKLVKVEAAAASTTTTP